MTNNARIYDFPGTDNHRNHNDNNQITTTGTTGTTSSTGRARAIIRKKNSANEIPPEVMEQAKARKAVFDRFLERFEATFGQWAGVSVREEVKAAIMQGCSEEVLNYCLSEAEGAPRPSWGYARAVLRRMIAEGVLSADDLEAQTRQRQRCGSYGHQHAGGFMQREYRDEDFAEGFFVEFDPPED